MDGLMYFSKAFDGIRVELDESTVTAVTEGFLDQKHDIQTCLSLWPNF
jgi:hypothetical protein